MDILQIKKVINQWQNNLSSANNDYMVIKVIKDMISTYLKLDSSIKILFLENVKPLYKKIFNFLYSNDPLVRKNVVNLAYTIESNELVYDVIKYLKIEKDYDNIVTYLKYIEKFKVVGFISDLMEFSKKTENLFIKMNLFYIILSLCQDYRGYQTFFDYVFQELVEKISKDVNSHSLIIFVYKKLIQDAYNYYSQKRKINVISFFINSYDLFFMKTAQFLDFLLKNGIENEQKAEALANIYAFLFLVKNILDKYTNKNIDKDNESLNYLKIDLIDVLKTILYELQDKFNFLSFFYNIIDDLNLTESFKNYFENNVNKEDLIKFLLELIHLSNEKLALKIIDFIVKFDVNMDVQELKILEDFCKSNFKDYVVILCVDIFSKLNYYEPIFFFLKYMNSFNQETKDKINSVFRDIVKQRIKKDE